MVTLIAFVILELSCSFMSWGILLYKLAGIRAHEFAIGLDLP